MRQTLRIVTLAVAIVALGVSYAVAQITQVDIDAQGQTKECEVNDEEVLVGNPQIHAVVTANWVIATCRSKLTDTEVENLGGPFKNAQVYTDFDCFVEADGTAEEIPAVLTRAVLTPSGNLNIECIAERAP